MVIIKITSTHMKDEANTKKGDEVETTEEEDDHKKEHNDQTTKEERHDMTNEKDTKRMHGTEELLDTKEKEKDAKQLLDTKEKELDTTKEEKDAKQLLDTKDKELLDTNEECSTLWCPFSSRRMRTTLKLCTSHITMRRTLTTMPRRNSSTRIQKTRT